MRSEGGLRFLCRLSSTLVFSDGVARVQRFIMRRHVCTLFFGSRIPVHPLHSICINTPHSGSGSHILHRCFRFRNIITTTTTYPSLTIVSNRVKQAPYSTFPPSRRSSPPTSARLFEREWDAATEYQKAESSSSSLMKKDEEDEGDGRDICASKSVLDGRHEMEWKSKENDADDSRGVKEDSSMSVTKKEGDGSGKVDLKKGSAR